MTHYVQFHLYGHSRANKSEGRDRTITVKIDGDNPKGLIDQVMSHDEAKTHIEKSAFFTLKDGKKLVERNVDLDGVGATPRKVVGEIYRRTRDYGLFQGYVNQGKRPNFMTYRLANHVVDVYEGNKELKSGSDPKPQTDEEKALKGLQKALAEAPDQTSLPRAVANQISGLNASISSHLKNHEPNPGLSVLVDRNEKYLRAAAEFGAKNSDLQFLDQSVDLSLDTRSVMCDTDGVPLPYLRTRVREIMASQFPGQLGKTVQIDDRWQQWGDDEAERTDKPVLRIQFGKSDGLRMQRALKMVLDELTMDDEPDIVIRGHGNAMLNPRILETPERGVTVPTVVFQSQTPSFLSRRLHGSSDHPTLMHGYDRRPEDLLIEARAFINENANQFENEYRQWREKVDTMMVSKDTPGRGF